MTTVQRPESAHAWDLRGFWASGMAVTVTMSDRCIIRTVVGRVSSVAVTGAFATVDGWHLPMSDVLRVARATVADGDEYARVVAAASREGGGRVVMAGHAADTPLMRLRTDV